jgi:hypothetical protein
MTTVDHVDIHSDILAIAAQIIDNAIPIFSGRTLVETSEVIDVLLDTRNKLTEINKLD